jgi:nucleolar protein 56
MASNACSVVYLELGIAAFKPGGSLVASKKFDNAISSYGLLKSGVTPEETMLFIEKLRSFETVLTNDVNIVAILQQAGLNSQLMPEDEQQSIQNNKPLFIVKAGFANNEYEAIQALREFAINLSSSRVKEVSEHLDLHVIQSINALDELDKIINTMSARMREWYGLHFPELDNLVQSIVLYAEIVSKAGLRGNITEEILQSTGSQDKKIEVILDAAKRSKGGDLTSENLVIINRLADQIIAQSDLRKLLADHIELAMETVAPNVKEMLTATVGARIIAKAGSLARLAMLPASTIQVLGAEKALFRALKTGARPPKHGLLFQHPLIHSAPKWQRGKIARAVASKVTIAARIDYYRHNGKDKTIYDKLNVRINEIREKYREPIPEEERERKYKDHIQRQHQFKSGRGVAINKRNKRKKKDRRKRFGKRRY